MTAAMREAAAILAEAQVRGDGERARAAARAAERRQRAGCDADARGRPSARVERIAASARRSASTQLVDEVLECVRRSGPLSPGWVAGSVRARHMLARRIGRDQARAARRVAVARGCARRAVRAAPTAASCGPEWTSRGAQRGVAETALWHIRVLAGWAPPGALEAIRALAAWFELANIEDRLAFLAGGEPPTPFALGGLATAWPRIADARTVAEVRAALAGLAVGRSRGRGCPRDRRSACGWRGRGGCWRRSTRRATGPPARVALLVARELFLTGRSAGRPAAHADPPGIGSAWAQAGSCRRAARRRCPHRRRGRSTASSEPATCGAPRWPGGGASSRTPRVLAHAAAHGRADGHRQRRAAGRRRLAHGGGARVRGARRHGRRRRGRSTQIA